MTDTKTFGIVDVDIKATTDDDGVADGSFEAILSAPTLDRDGEVIDGRAFDPLPDHITIDIDHGMSVGTTVGSGTPYYEGDILKFKGTFSSIPRAQEVRTLVTEGHIRKMSVAFMNAARETDPDDERTHIRRAELLNAAIVPIPSNREASILAAKALAREAHESAIDSPSTVVKNRDPIPDSGGWVTDGANHYWVSPETVAALKAHHKTSTDTDPEPAAAPAAADAPAEVAVDPKALAALAEAEALLA